MTRFARPVLLVIATSAFTFAVVVMDRSTVSVLSEAGGCSSACDVGGAGVNGVSGTGGLSSGGKARGSFEKFPGEVPGVNFTTAGSENAGRAEASGAFEGTIAGAFVPAIEDFVGHTTGIYGNCNGRSSKCP